MIRELVEFGEFQRKETHDEGIELDDAFEQNETIEFAICLKKDYSFDKIMIVDSKKTTTEDILVRTSGISPRLIVDKSEYVLGIKIEKVKGDKGKYKILKYPEYLKAYRSKINKLKSIKTIQPLIDFYENGEYKKAAKAFKPELLGKDCKGNVAFLVSNSYVHLDNKIIDHIKTAYHDELQKLKERQKKDGNFTCSVCCTSNYPIARDSHGPVKGVPKGKSSGTYLISYDSSAFWSYDLIEKDKKGGKDKIFKNRMSGICTHCAKLYREALNYLLSPSNMEKRINAKGKEYNVKIYKHRRNMGEDTAVIFWIKGDKPFNATIFDSPDVYSIQEFIHSLDTGRKTSLATEMFYSLTLSSSSARIIIRDFIQMSLKDMKKHIDEWFKDIDIGKTDGTGHPIFAPLWQMGEHLRRPNDEKKKDEIPSRAQVYLWKAAVQGRQYQIPLWIMSRAVTRIRMDSYKLSDEDKKAQKVIADAKVSKRNNVSSEKDKGENSLSFGRVFSTPRMALIKLVLNRKGKGEEIMKQLNGKSQDKAYTSGRILALMAKIQYHAARREPNTSVVSRHYSAVSVTPSSAFGRLFKNTRHHLDKIGQDNPGLKVNLEKALAGLCNKVDDDGGFPNVFTLEEQGRFALGFYHQRFKPVKGDEDEREAQTDDIPSDDDDENDSTL